MSRLSLHFLRVLKFGLLEVLARAARQLKEIKGRRMTQARVQACVLFEDGILPYPKYLWGVFCHLSVILSQARSSLQAHLQM